MPPLYLDGDLASRVQPSTVATYRRYGRPFAEWLLEHRLSPRTSEEWDDLLVEWKNDRAVSKTHFIGAVAAVEFFFVGFKGSLSWSRAVVKGMEVSHTPRHTIPMTFGPACLLAVEMCRMGYARLAAGMLVQQSRGLRPSEMLNLIASDIVLPERAIKDGKKRYHQLGSAQRHQSKEAPGGHRQERIFGSSTAASDPVDWGT